MRCTLESVTWAPAGVPVFSDCSLELLPGLSLVRGGEGRGKSSLLRLLAGRIVPDAGSVRRDAGEVWLEDPSDPAHDPEVARGWLATRQGRFPNWSEAVAADLAEALALGPHLDKPMYMLSAGSRRKIGLVGAVASGAGLTLLDTPYAALDGRSCRVLDEVLAEASEDPSRVWVIADYVRPAGWGEAVRCREVDLGE